MAALNKVILMGYLTADPELKFTPSGVAVTAFSIAVGRRFAKETDEVKADFINVVCWRNNAEFVTKYFSKGKPIVIVGSLQTRSYTAQDGSKRYVTEVIADEVTFGSGASDSEGRNKPADKPGNVKNGTYQESMEETVQAVPDANFEEVADDDDLPF